MRFQITLTSFLALATIFALGAEARRHHHSNHHKKVPVAPAHAAEQPSPTDQGSTTEGSGSTSAGRKCEAPDGFATQYWDCCKVAAAWPGHSNLISPADSCAIDGISRLESSNIKSGCDGGDAFACNNHQPWVSPTNPNLSYAVGVRWTGLGVNNFYGACYEIVFKEQPQKTLIFQALNAGEDYKFNQIDIQAPGGGVGVNNGCPKQWQSPPDGWGKRFGGVQSIEECSQLPEALRSGCEWRFNWLAPADHPHGINPTIQSMCRVKCPKEMTDRTGIMRHDDDDSWPAAAH
ncbi:hypothetical protein OC861_002945 [Tilletia horrida]|nr:hypothetical protein OC861_002945 [Tilletia horrida]